MKDRGMTERLRGEKPQVKLSDGDGNVFFIIGRCRKAARNHGWAAARIDTFSGECMDATTYDEVLRLVMENFDVQ